MDHAGLMLQPLPFLIELRLLERLLGQISISLHRFLSLAQETMVVTVEKPSTPSSGWPRMRSQMRPAPSTEPEVTTMVKNAQVRSCARTARQANHALPKTTGRSTRPRSTDTSRERQL